MSDSGRAYFAAAFRPEKTFYEEINVEKWEKEIPSPNNLKNKITNLKKKEAKFVFEIEQLSREY